MKAFWGTTKKCENKNLIFSLRPGLGREGLKTNESWMKKPCFLILMYASIIWQLRQIAVICMRLNTSWTLNSVVNTEVVKAVSWRRRNQKPMKHLWHRFFRKNSEWLKDDKYFCKKAPSHIFDRMPLPLVFSKKTALKKTKTLQDNAWD